MRNKLERKDLSSTCGIYRHTHILIYPVLHPASDKELLLQSPPTLAETELMGWLKHANAKFRNFAQVMWKKGAPAPVKESCSRWLTALAEVQLPTTLRAGLSQVRKLWTRRSAFLCRRERICDLGWWIRWAYARKRARPGRQLCPPHRPQPTTYQQHADI